MEQQTLYASSSLSQTYGELISFMPGCGESRCAGGRQQLGSEKVHAGVSYVSENKTMSDSSRQRRRREEKVWQRPVHKNVVPLLGITTDYIYLGLNLIAMISPWMERGDLFKALKTDPSVSDRLHYVRLALSASSRLCSII